MYRGLILCSISKNMEFPSISELQNAQNKYDKFYNLFNYILFFVVWHWHFSFSGGTRTDLALKAAENEFFCSTCDARNNVPQVLLVLTDGKSSYNASPVKEASQQMKVRVWHIFQVFFNVALKLFWTRKK